MTDREFWTPEEQGRIAEAAARIRQNPTISGMAIPGIGYVSEDGTVMTLCYRYHPYVGPMFPSISHDEVQQRIDELKAEND